MILVADDDATLRESIASRLRTLGFDVAIATNGEEAVTRLGQGDVDLIILDLVLSRVSGQQVLASAQKLANPPRCIVLSALADAWSRRRTDTTCLILAKPVDINLLVVAVRRSLTGKLI